MLSFLLFSDPLLMASAVEECVQNIADENGVEPSAVLNSHTPVITIVDGERLGIELVEKPSTRGA